MKPLLPHGGGGLAVRKFSSLASCAGGFFFESEHRLFFLRGNKCRSGGSDLLVKLEDFRVVLGNLLACCGGGLEGAKLGFLVAAEFFDLREFRLGGGVLLAKAGEHGSGIGDFLFGAGMVVDGL